MKVVVLGAGLVGGPMARDLAADPRFEVTVADRDEQALARLAGPRLATIRRDLADPNVVTELVRGFDFVVGAVPGFLGFQTLRAVLEAGRHVVDIAFFPEDAMQLDDLARSRGVTAIVDCGVMPGMGGALVARAARRLDEVDSALIQVGGLPEVRQWPWEYRAVFSPIDVIEEYTRPARYRENGELVVAPALANPTLVDFPGVGTLEAFDTDGLRTLLDTIPARNLRERTLRYPGHIEKIRLLRECGFFGDATARHRGPAGPPHRPHGASALPDVAPARGRGRPHRDAGGDRRPQGRTPRPLHVRPARSFRPCDRHPQHGPHHRLHRDHGACGCWRRGGTRGGASSRRSTWAANRAACPTCSTGSLSAACITVKRSPSH